MVADPADTPLTTPLSEPAVATAVLLLLHSPPVMPSVYNTAALEHTVAGPLMGVGVAVTLMVVVVAQPPGTV
jgi:hypothetical protein